MLYAGTPGSGKSLHTARDIRDSLGPKRRPVIANFDVNPRTRGYRERFTYKPNNDLTPEFLIEFAAGYWERRKVREDATLLVLDEAQLVSNSPTRPDGGARGRVKSSRHLV